ncbi:MAG: 3-keto-5-aminohexanoate cleavage protein [Chloroflexi bacterium]|nr:3-keto-5-aminohexanoate cleavage protein [Chloroflexota bacterium]
MVEDLARMAAEHRKRLEGHFPAPYQPRIPTMEKKVAVEVAMPGWQPNAWYEERGVKNLPPISFDDQANAIVECVKAGAAIVHTHPRDPKTGLSAPVTPPSALPRHEECLIEVMDRAFKEVDFVTAHHTWVWDFSKSKAADYITDTKNLLEAGQAKGLGNRYVQLAMIMTIGLFTEDRPIHTVKAIQEGTKWFEDHGIKPMFSVESFAVNRVKQHLVDTGIAKSKPCWIAIQEGKHNDDRIFADPWSYLEVITSFELVRAALGEDTFIGIHAAGRNWLAATAMALLLGAELVRVGIEDIFYLYPHRDDISQKASDSTELIVRLIRALGREVATPQEVRDRVGITLTK